MPTTTLTVSSPLARAPRVLGHRAPLALLAAAALLAGGCSGMLQHGKHTQAQKNLAQQRLAEMKSATEYQMANQAFLAGDLEKALKHVTYCLELNPLVVKSNILHGRILLEQSKIEPAAAAFAKAESLDPRNVDAWYFQGLLAERIDRKDDALRRYQGAADLDSANPQYPIAAAEMLIALGRTDDAETYLSARRDAFKHSAGIRQTLGHIAMLKNDPRTAAAFFTEARLLAPDDQNITEDLIRAQIATGEFGQAEYNLAHILSKKENKDRRDLVNIRAKCLSQLERHVEARDLLVALTKDQAAGADPDTWIALGQTCIVLRDYQRVRLAAARTIALAPTRPEGYTLRAVYLKNTGNPAAAEEFFAKAAAIDPTSDNFVLLGLLQQELGKTDAARNSFQAAVAANPNDPAASRLLAAFTTSPANATAAVQTP